MSGPRGVQNAQFWMVWNPHGRNPTFRHWSRAAAENEAARLASLHPGTPFVVLEALSYKLASAVETVVLTTVEDEDAIPF